MTAHTLEALSEIKDELQIDVVLGLGYDSPERLDPVIAEMPDNLQDGVCQQIQSMAKRMEQADLLITSNGRTLYEAASLNLPMISISQNVREEKHPYANVSRGVISLGQAEYVNQQTILTAVTDYIQDADKREQMRTALANHDIANGIKRIKRIIFDEADESC